MLNGGVNAFQWCSTLSLLSSDVEICSMMCHAYHCFLDLLALIVIHSNDFTCSCIDFPCRCMILTDLHRFWIMLDYFQYSWLIVFTVVLFMMVINWGYGFHSVSMMLNGFSITVWWSNFQLFGMPSESFSICFIDLCSCCDDFAVAVLCLIKSLSWTMLFAVVFQQCDQI